MLASPVRACLVLLCGLQDATGDLNYKAWRHDPLGQDALDLHLRLVGGSMVNYFSAEHIETCSCNYDPQTGLCTELGAGPVNPPRGMTQRFQHPNYRELSDEAYAVLQEHSYLDEDQLDNPNAGKIYNGNYTETIWTKEFVPDDDLLPLPHSRTQLCHYALRLSEPIASQNTAAWSRFKQLVAFGFETEFHFRILHQKPECVVSGQTEWCQPQGADGFAFVVQNDNRKAVGTEVSGLGYGFANSLAVEFDTSRDQSLGDRTANHISVHIPPAVGELNSAAARGEIAYTDDIPLLSEGTHVVRIEYSTTEYAWDDLGSKFDADLGAERLSTHAAGRPGILTVEFDGARVIAVPVDLAHVVQVDGSVDYRENTPTQPDRDAYDEPRVGSAWVGFTSSTHYFRYQSVDILSWTFIEKPACPSEGGGDILCRVNEGTSERAKCNENGTELCGIVIKNIARNPIKVSARHAQDRLFEATPCERGLLQWNQLHPYFLGCSRLVKFTGDLQELAINTLDGSRAAIVDDPHTLMKAPTPFKKRSIFEWCVLEHKHDPKRLYFAQCSCEYCVRLLHLQASYAVYYQHLASQRFGLFCPCFEASNVEHDMSKPATLEPLKHMRIHVSRGCGFTSQCAETLKFALCEEAYQTYQLGNPLSPTILENGFEDLVLDGGKVADGTIRGDACDCTPNVKPYVGSADGGSGQCSAGYVLETSTQPTVSHCQARCVNDNLCEYYGYWTQTEMCKTYWFCEWELCKDTLCMQAVTYQMAQLGQFFNTLGVVQYYNVYPLRTVQTSKEDCQSCLHLYEEEFCVVQCGPISRVPYLHWPGGPLCATCIFAGNRWHELTQMKVEKAKSCVMTAMRLGLDPWTDCNEISMEVLGHPASDLFNGVVTHYLSECPGRTFEESGAICVPNIYAIPHFPLQLLSRMAAINNTVWSDRMQCLNAFCDLVPRSECYYRLAGWDFSRSDQEEIARPRLEWDYNGASVVDGALTFIKSHEQYAVSSPLPWTLENTTIEAWITVGEIERITNIAENKIVQTTSSWQDDYLAAYVVDGDFNSYWQSQVGEEFRYNLEATLIVDLNETMSAQAFNIWWKQPAADFEFHVSRDNVTWEKVMGFVGNSEVTTKIGTFYRGRFLRITMTRAATLRTAAPGLNCPVYSIWEVEVIFDQVVSTLKPAVETHVWYNVAARAIDGNVLTFWSTPTGEASSYILIDFGESLDVNYTIIRWQYQPDAFSVVAGSSACSEGVPSVTGQLFELAGSRIQYDNEYPEPWSGRCLAVIVQEAGTLRNERFVALSEVEVYNAATNLANANATVIAEMVPTNDTGAHLTAIDGAMDGDPSTYWMLIPESGMARVLLDLGGDEYIISIEVKWATVDGAAYSASAFSVWGGVTLPSDTFEELDSVIAFLLMSRSFVVFKQLRYVVLSITQVMSSNPNGHLALEDFIVWKRSNNLVTELGSVAEASTEWANCDTCTLRFDSETYIHGSSPAVDGDFDSWWGAPFAVDPALQVYLEVQLAQEETIDVVGIWWQYPARDIKVDYTPFTLAAGAQTWGPIQTELGNVAYRTAISFASSYSIGGLRVYISDPTETFSGEPVMGIKELQLFSVSANLAEGKTIYASDESVDASQANDDSAVTRWFSVGAIKQTNLTVDLAEPTYMWGIRLLFPSNMIPTGFFLSVSDDPSGMDENFTVVDKFYANKERDVYALVNLTAQLVRVTLEQTSALLFAVRTFGVYGSDNLALGQDTDASYSWHHSSYQALDGDANTFWVSEPLATTAVIQVDLGVLTFVGGGIEIVWKFPASVYSLHVSEDAVDWQTLATFNSNVSVTRYQEFFITRYVELRMDQAPVVASDIVFAIYSFNVIFDTNLAHFKYINATHTIDDGLFHESKAADGDMSTYWMPQQGSETSRIVFDLTTDRSISGFSTYWRMAPYAYRVEAYRDDTEEWTTVASWVAFPGEPSLYEKQTSTVGIIARKLAIEVEERAAIDEGTMVAMREFELNIPDMSRSIAEGRFVNSSAGVGGMVAGNPPWQANDGNIKGTYWHAGWETHEAWWLVHFDDLPDDAVGRRQSHLVARIVINWRWQPLEYEIQMEYQGGWRTVFAEYDLPSNESNVDYLTDVSFLEQADKLMISVKSAGTLMGIREVNVYASETLVPPVVEPRADPCKIEAHNMIDLDNQSFWMSPSGSNNVNIILDLQAVYQVQEIEIWMGFKTSNFFVFVSESGYPNIEKKMTSTSLWGFVHMVDQNPVYMRYMRFFVTKGYEDTEADVFGTSVRDIRVWIFNNRAKGKIATSDSTWDFPGSAAVDGSNLTEWISRFGTDGEELVVDLGSIRNVAGVSVSFGHGAGSIQFLHASELGDWYPFASVASNNDLEIKVPSTIHFSARYIKLALQRPLSNIPDPDEPRDGSKYKFIFSVKELQVFEHTGGGGVVGLESLDGTEFSTIVFGQREPGEWMLGSERDIFTKDAGGLAFPEDVGSEIHVAVTFETIMDLPGGVNRYTRVALYRNGARYGSSYRAQAPIERLTRAHQVRLVVGVRSSAHAPDWNGSDPREGSLMAKVHSPFFEGQIHKMSIIKNALTAEEVYGLYETKFGAAERGCHCFDACETGFNRLNPAVPVPCSGQGVCLRHPDPSTGLSGLCQCQPGFSGNACQHHCSNLSEYGCCEADDDCPTGIPCNMTTKACSA